MGDGSASRGEQLYEELPERVPGEGFVFMNHGYAHLDGANKVPWLSATDQVHLYNVQLLEQVLRGVNLTGKRVLEVGCGRGGNCSAMARYLEAASVVGLDYSKAGIAFCKRTHRVPNLEFVHGSAMELPFADGSFDVVVNIESSHCYPDPIVFYKEVFRVLRPGGVFCYTDVFPPETVDSMTQALPPLGFKQTSLRDITANVEAGLKLAERTYRETIMAASKPDEESRRMAANVCEGVFASIVRYTERSRVYLIVQLDKPM